MRIIDLSVVYKSLSVGPNVCLFSFPQPISTIPFSIYHTQYTGHHLQLTRHISLLSNTSYESFAFLKWPPQTRTFSCKHTEILVFILTLTTPSTLGDEFVHIHVGDSKRSEHQETGHHVLHKKLFEKRLPRFFDVYLKEETSNTVMLPDLEPDVFGLLIKWLFFAELENEKAYGLISLYGFAESLGEDSLMDDVMTALYSKYFRAQNVPLPPLYKHTYNHTKPGSKLRDFQVRRFAWELTGLEKRRIVTSDAPEVPYSSCEEYKEMAANVKDLNDDLWPVLSRMADDLPPLYQGVCKFHVHSEEAKETCLGALVFPEENPLTLTDSFAGSHAGSAGYDQGSLTGTRWAYIGGRECETLFPASRISYRGSTRDPQGSVNYDQGSQHTRHGTHRGRSTSRARSRIPEGSVKSHPGSQHTRYECSCTSRPRSRIPFDKKEHLHSGSRTHSRQSCSSRVGSPSRDSKAGSVSAYSYGSRL